MIGENSPGWPVSGLDPCAARLGRLTAGGIAVFLFRSGPASSHRFGMSAMESLKRSHQLIGKWVSPRHATGAGVLHAPSGGVAARF
jgi:hypothetical protein